MLANNYVVKLKVIITVAIVVAQLLHPLSYVFANDSGCSDVLVAFARGSGQPQGDDEDELKEKPQLVAFFNELEKREPSNINVEYDELIYDAAGDKRDFVEAEFSWFKFGEYRDSVSGGIYNLGMKLEKAVQDCPDQKIVLGGYSQGAHVIGNTLHKVSDKAASSIVYAGLFGDPKFKVDSWAARGSFTESKHGAVGGVLEARDEFPEEFKGKVDSWCSRGDGICENSWYRSIFKQENHNSTYQEYEIPLSVQAAAARLEHYFHGFNTETDIERYAQNEKLDLVIAVDAINFNGAKTNVANVKRFAEPILERAGKLSSDTKVGLVTYKSYLHNDFIYNKVPLTRDFAAIKSQLQFTSTFGKSSATYSGINESLYQDWRMDARKIILLVPYGIPLGKEEGSGLTINRVVSNARSQDVSIYPIIPAATALGIGGNARLKLYERLAEETNGIPFKLNRNITPNAGLMASGIVNAMQASPNVYHGAPYKSQPGEPLKFSVEGLHNPSSLNRHYRWKVIPHSRTDYFTEGPTAKHTYNDPYKGAAMVSARDGRRAVNTIMLPVDVGEDYVPFKPPPPPNDIKVDVLNRSSSQVRTALGTVAMVGSTQAQQGSQTVRLSWELPETGEDTAPASIYRIYKPNGDLLGIAGPEQASVTITDVPLDADLNLSMKTVSTAGNSEPESVSEVNEDYEEETDESDNGDSFGDNSVDNRRTSEGTQSSSEHPVIAEAQQQTTTTTSEPEAIEAEDALDVSPRKQDSYGENRESNDASVISKTLTPAAFYGLVTFALVVSVRVVTYVYKRKKTPTL